MSELQSKEGFLGNAGTKYGSACIAGTFLNFATRAGTPQQHMPITVGPCHLTLSTFPVGENWSTQRKPRTFESNCWMHY